MRLRWSNLPAAQHKSAGGNELTDLGFSRRDALAGAAAAAAIWATPALAQSGNAGRIRSALERANDANIARLREWIALPSIAAENRQMMEGARLMADLAARAGFAKPQIVPTKGHPGVFATMDNGAKRTVGLYFMYDVKQYDPAEWTLAPPLEGRIVDKPGFGRVMVGRGAVNQKGPENNVLSALIAMNAAGVKPPVNLVLVAEGEEEIGSPNFRDIVTRPDVLAALKRAQGIYIPVGWQKPSGGVDINLGAKGVVELELVASGAKWGRGPKSDIHSSLAAMVDSPAWRLVEALETITDKGGTRIAIDGWYDRVRPLTARQKELLKAGSTAAEEAAQKQILGVERWIDDLDWQAAQERLAAQPTFNIEGLVSGYTGPGGKTILPGRAVAKIDMRLVPDMTKDDCVAKLRAHLDRFGYKDIEVNVSGGYDPTETDENSALIKAEDRTYRAMGVTPTYRPRLAGSWPGVVFTSAPVSLPAGQFGLGHGSRQHAPDEYFVVESANPNLAGLVDGALSHVNLWYEIARG